MPPVLAAAGAIGSALAPAAGAIGSGLGAVGSGLASGAGALGSALGTGAGALGSALGAGAELAGAGGSALYNALSTPTGQYIADKGIDAYKYNEQKQANQASDEAQKKLQQNSLLNNMIYQPQQNKLQQLLSMGSPYTTYQPMQQNYYQLPVNYGGGQYGS